MKPALFYSFDHITRMAKSYPARIVREWIVTTDHPGNGNEFIKLKRTAAELEVNFGTEAKPQWKTIEGAMSQAALNGASDRSYYIECTAPVSTVEDKRQETGDTSKEKQPTPPAPVEPPKDEKPKDEGTPPGLPPPPSTKKGK